MTAWNLATFLAKFEAGELGRKSQYSTYWVNKFDGCNILCNKGVGYRSSRDGEKVIAVYMGPDLCVFNANEVTQSGEWQARYTMPFRDIGMESITESGLIDVQRAGSNPSVKSILFQLGADQYLIEPYWSEKHCVEFKTYLELNKSGIDIMKAYADPTGKRNLPRYGFAGATTVAGANLVKLPEKFQSVDTARLFVIPETVKTDPTNSFCFRNWWFTPKPGHVPWTMSENNRAILKNPPMPWEYGLTMDMVKPILCGANPVENTADKIKTKLGALYPKIVKYKADKQTYEQMIARLQAAYIDQDDERHFQNAQIAILPLTGEIGLEHNPAGGYFVQGALHDKSSDSHVGFRYGGMERLAATPCVKPLFDWYYMSKEVGHV